MQLTHPISKDLVLLGGGHTHVEVLRRFGMKPLPGVRLTLVSPDVQTPYSGMLPGYVSGFYSYDDCHIDLPRLARYANARFIRAEACGVDLVAQEVNLRGRPALSYNVLSINVGIAPNVSEVPGASEYAISVKPISTFVGKFDKVLGSVRESTATYRAIVVGGGPGGVELACALAYRLRNEHRDTHHGQNHVPNVEVSLVSRGQILRDLPSYARRCFLQLLKERHIQLYEVPGGTRAVNKNHITLADGRFLPFDACFWCTEAGAPSWLAASRLPVDDRGFMHVNEYLQSEDGPSNVFGAGDASSIRLYPRPKAGVYAVRAGPPLADNIARYIQGQPLRPWIPQSSNLNLITAGDKYAVGVKGWFGARGGLLWTWKDWIDRKFMAKYGSDLVFPGEGSGMSMPLPKLPVGFADDAAALREASMMRCAGCGSKIGATTLTRVLRRLQRTITPGLDSTSDSPTMSGNKSSALVGLDAPDDAAVLAPPPPGHVTVHTVDFFRAMINDPYVFGGIAAAHALSDCYAMGANPVAALAIAVVPFAASAIIESDLYQLLAGAHAVLSSAGCELVGGHSSEGGTHGDLSLGLSVYGTVQREKLLKKGDLRDGQALVLTKAVGTGAIFAAEMKGQAAGRWIATAIDKMLLTNAAAMQVFREFGATACTDITGFGLLGHLGEMAEGAGRLVEVHAAKVPLLPGAAECVAAGCLSSLHEENSSNVKKIVFDAEKVASDLAVWPLLVDPQTSGGLVASIPAETADACVEALKRRGYECAAVVGWVGATRGEEPSCIRVV